MKVPMGPKTIKAAVTCKEPVSYKETVTTKKNI